MASVATDVAWTCLKAGKLICEAAAFRKPDLAQELTVADLLFYKCAMNGKHNQTLMYPQQHECHRSVNHICTGHICMLFLSFLLFVMMSVRRKWLILGFLIIAFIFVRCYPHLKTSAKRINCFQQHDRCGWVGGDAML